ncbi:MAG: PEP-CTERM sorting domain-containing protein [Planctomycetaceae bacterium]|nr:PEP-CTERM sorting domain-containing protein [Planctomycetaceae bacterium]
MKRTIWQLLVVVFVLSFVASVQAEMLQISLGIRETGSDPNSFPGIGANGGSSGGIEWVNLDGQTLVADNQWHTFTFTPSTDTLTGFAGGSANAILDTVWGTIEHIRFKSTGSNQKPWVVYIDDITQTWSGGTHVIADFEDDAVGSAVLFRAPSFSGSTSANIVGTNSALVTDETALSGSQSCRVEFDFVDDADTKWLRLTTFGAANLPNPAVWFVEDGFNPTISFSLKAVPEPSTLVLFGLAIGGALLLWRRQR